MRPPRNWRETNDSLLLDLHGIALWTGPSRGVRPRWAGTPGGHGEFFRDGEEGEDEAIVFVSRTAIADIRQAREDATTSLRDAEAAILQHLAIEWSEV